MCHKVNRFNNIYILLCQKKVEQVRQLSNLLLRLDLQKCDKTSNYGSTLQQNTFASNTCSQEGRAQLPREGSRRSPWWRPQASSGWSPGWRSVAFAQQTQLPSSWSWLVALLSMFLGHGLVFVHLSRYVQVASSSPLDAVIGRVNRRWKSQRQMRLSHRLQSMHVITLKATGHMPSRFQLLKWSWNKVLGLSLIANEADL